ncbi:hypothetical protein C8A01DRAFT_36551 [Parachaetomium inaequale]|uniref:Uncharacterized protein n=1 Tax=Parachaetomium inaequale TaxID=2588326 RepID=A0AAN6SR17_9PEZI|nr:hypothetical protein C8A01DRAFT_36551 [Parachaetomium inaequale]
MYPDAKAYQTVAARPDTPPTAPSSPSTLSSLSTWALLDLGFSGDANDLSSPRPPHHQPHTPDRRSVDTIVALRFYGSHEHSRHSHDPSIAELPATPLPLPVPAPPPTPPPSTTPPLKARAFHVPKRKPIGTGNLQVYRNPAGEPWVRVPPPAAPLPAPPPPKRCSPRVAQQGRLRPTFSLFPPPQRQMQQPPVRLPRLLVPGQGYGQGHTQGQGQRQNNSTSDSNPVPNQNPTAKPSKRNFSRPSPIVIHPPTISLPISIQAPATAPISGSGSGSASKSRDGLLNGRGNNRSPPLTAIGTVTLHFPPPPGQASQPADSAGGRRSLPSWLWGWGGTKTEGTSPGFGSQKEG